MIWNSMDWPHPIESEFDPYEGVIHLNAGTLSRTPRVVVDQVIAETRAAEKDPTAYLFSAWERMWHVQKELADFLGARPQDLILRPNVTYALNDFLLGMPLASGEILLSDLEYGAIANLCQFRAERDGLGLRRFPLAELCANHPQLSPQELVDWLLGQLRPQTRLLLLSHVMTGNGLVIPLAAIARECRQRGVLLAVDGAHGPGALPIEFAELSDVDFYGGNIHKWLMGPKGTGFGWVNPIHQDAMQPVQAGWTTYSAPMNFARFAPGHRFTQSMLMASTINFAPFMALPTLLSWWKTWGFSRILEHRAGLRAKLLSGMLASGWQLISPQHQDLRGPLLSFHLPTSLANEGWSLMERLAKEKNLVVSTPMVHGRSALRLSPSTYTRVDEIESGVKILAELISADSDK